MDAALRGAYREPPTPRRPSRRFTWGVRGAMTVPVASVIVALTEALTSSLPPHRLVLVGIAASVLLLAAAWVWWSAGRPRLDRGEQARLSSELGRDGRRELHRALWRSQPIPGALQPFAHPYVSNMESGSLLGTLGASFGVSSMVLNLSRPLGGSGLVGVAFAFVVVMGVVMLGFVVVLCRMRKHLRRHDGLLSRPRPSTSPPDSH